MASFQETTKGYRVQVAVKGQRDSATFPTKREAQQWAAQRETEFHAQAVGKTGTVKTLAQTFKRYAEEVSPKRKGWHFETLRLAAFLKSNLPCALRLSDVTPDHIAKWRDVRLNEVSDGTVLREIALLSAVFEVAVREWRWIKSNPVKFISKPPKPEHRERLIAWSEIKSTLRALNHHPGAPAKSVTQSVALCFLAALRTGMRASELSKLEWTRYHDHYIRLNDTKTTGRSVPLSKKSRMIFERARGFDRDLVFGVSSQSLDVLFRRARVKAELEGFTFHDARHTAATWLGQANRISLLEMCKIFGWKDPKYALVYFNPTTADLANKLG